MLVVLYIYISGANVLRTQTTIFRAYQMFRWSQICQIQNLCFEALQTFTKQYVVSHLCNFFYNFMNIFQDILTCMKKFFAKNTSILNSCQKELKH